MLKQFTTLLLLLCFTVVNAQQTKIYTHNNRTYAKALSLYQQEQYLAAQNLFKDAQSTAIDMQTTGNCAYYIANCAVRLNQQGAAHLIEKFVTDYPTSTKKNAAFNDVANYYYANSKYSYALKWLNKVDEKDLNTAEKETFNFKKGYALFNSKQKKKAKKYFDKVSDSETYGAQAKYYLGFIAYQGDDYKEAATYFNQVQDQEKYQEKMAYFHVMTTNKMLLMI